MTILRTLCRSGNSDALQHRRSAFVLLGIGCWLALSFLLSHLPLSAQDTPDPRAAELIAKLCSALTNPDEALCTKELLPLLHRSLLSSGGDDLAREVKALTLKKARLSMNKYILPAQVSRIEKTPTTSVGMGTTAEQGTVFEYFLQPKEKNATPAPVKVFFPADGSAPKISHFGSL